MQTFTWEKAREELRYRRERALTHGGETAVARQRKGGRRLVRERLDELLDPGTFVEIGTMAVDRRYDSKGNALEPTPAAYVMGLAEVDGRPVAVGGEDFTVSAGHTIGLDRKKGGMGGFVEDMAHEFRIPLMIFVEGVGGGVGMQQTTGHAPIVSSSSFARCYELLGEVPVIAAGMGPCAGGSAGRLVITHFSIMTRDTACVFAGGPPVVERALGHRIDKFDLGGAHIHTQVSGTIDNVAVDESDAIRQMKQFLSYLPQNVWEMAPVVETGDPPDRQDEILLKIIPEDRKRAYDTHNVIDVIFDHGSFFEIGPDWGRSLITGLARLGGFSVGVLASNPAHLGGALDAQASQKQTRFIELCDTFHIPLIYLVDVPGFMIGEAAEREGTLRKGMRALQALLEASVPMVTVHMRKSFGMACNATANPERLLLRIGWATGEFGDMPVEGGVAAAFRREIEAAEDPAAYRAQIEARLLEDSSPWKTAEAFGLEEMIDPVETRWYLYRFIKAAQGSIRTNLGKKYRCGPRL
ncbi:MAG: propionyl-CoA carboxylase [Chloroflexi bacterium]|nr:propionyl-CoA carboxylase [Chloroflexota bacterium]